MGEGRSSGPRPPSRGSWRSRWSPRPRGLSPDRFLDALYRAREVDARIGGLKEALAAGYQTARLSPSRRWALGQLGLYATAVLWDRNELETSVMVGQIRSTAVDLLRASGMDSSAALQALREVQLNAAVAKAPVE